MLIVLPEEATSKKETNRDAVESGGKPINAASTFMYQGGRDSKSYKTIHAPKDGQRIGPRHPLTFEPSDPAKTQYVPSDRVIAGHSLVKLSTG